MTPVEGNSRILLSRLRWLSALGVLGGGIIVIGSLVAVLQGKNLGGPALVLASLGAGLLLTSAYMLIPGQTQRLKQRIEVMSGLSVEQRRNRANLLARRVIVVSLVLLVPEIALAVALWRNQEWQPEIVGMLGTTLLLLGVFLSVYVRTRVGRSV